MRYVIFFDQFSRLLMTCVAADDTCGADQRQDGTTITMHEMTVHMSCRNSLRHATPEHSTRVDLPKSSLLMFMCSGSQGYSIRTVLDHLGDRIFYNAIRE
jgi:hypothetical protein